MNKVILMGRLTRDPEIRWPQNGEGMAVARYTLAVDRRRRQNAKEGEQTADFIQCVAFGKSAEFASNYFRQGLKIVVTGRIQTGSYTNKDGQKVYTTDVVVEEQEFAESKQNSVNAGGGQPQNQNYQQRPQNQGYAPQPPQNQGGYQQMPPQNQGYQQQPQNYQQPQNQGYAPQGGYQQPQNQMAPPDDFGFGSFDGDLPFN